ncbi:GGDEF domain-containing protein [Marinomonas fungiae]|uniref:diguanylate cyclase n=1 Tax=Marinomonas fungiae TaxID=1137284 RepID=A0A0K6IJQ7_9GAMM|nr:GGDEF domain-containing protein [Marinomonas fungiae]CUB03311.1 diguanylate cyclase (GGDEF) domain [Marinomonas fungiae]
MHKHCFNKILEWLLGNKDNPFEYTHHAVLLVAVVLYAYAAFLNYYLDVANIYNIYLQAAISLLVLIIWYLSRWKNQFRMMRFVFISVILLVSMPANWIGNGGSDGPTYIMIFGSLIYLSVSFKDLGVYRRIGQCYCILIPIPLIFIEQHYPELIFRYGTETQKQIDLMITFIIIGLFLIFMMESLATRFRLEKAKAEQLSEQLRALSEEDSLTGLYNRRILDKEYSSWKNQGRVFSLALLDLDHFKKLNDQWGHSYGDEVLVIFSALLKDIAIQNEGVAIRLGGEEFVLLLPLSSDITHQKLIQLAKRLSNTPLKHGPVSFSAGVAQDMETEGQYDLLKRADNLMYLAKENGRNLICK